MSTRSDKELPWDRLATTDQSGNRIYLYPTQVRGKWQKRRARLSLALILLFLFLPWIKIGGQQAILLDISNRRFAILGLTFWAHDAPLLFLVLGGAAISIAFMTAIWGRIWCGWACPQTVFVEQVFRRIERWIEGDSFASRKLDGSPMSFEKLVKKGTKWGIYTLISLLLSHSFLAYFVGTRELAQMMASSPTENPLSFLLMAGIAFLILFDLGWFREQFCTIVCPYGRFQSVLMDDQSAVVAYDLKRGEPRRGAPSDSGLQGDCVNCYRCVQVCPTGVDIRRGVQMECIACTACIDACDDVMARIKKPAGLIRYGNQSVSEGKSSPWVSWYLRPRAWVYLCLIGSCLAGLTVSAIYRVPIELTLIRAVGKPYEQIAPNQVVNHFKTDLRNQTFDEKEIHFSVDQERQKQGIRLVVSNHKSSLAPGEQERADLFIEFPKNVLTLGKGKIPIVIDAKSETHSKPIVFTYEASVVGPLQ